MVTRTAFASYVSILALTAALSVSQAVGASEILWTTNYGTDSGSCGSFGSPCRSISQAIENAVDGDAIWVGAGQYGNVSGQPGFAGPGDEHAQQLPPEYYDFQSCIICINKRVHIYSVSGAGVTTIDSGPNPSFSTTVLIVADGVVFGSSGHGFTITGGNRNGVVIDLQNWSPGSKYGVTVAGNVDVNDGTGFTINGIEDDPFRGCPQPINQYCPPIKGQILLAANKALANATGFWVEPKAFGILGQRLTFLVQGNLALGAGTGYYVNPGLANDCDECANDNWATVVSTVNNVAANGGVGFSMTRAGATTSNIATNNSQYGFLLVTAAAFTHNSATGNSGPGVIVALENPCYGCAAPSFGSFTQNNFYGNDRKRPPLSLDGGYLPGTYNLGPAAHCGVLNMGAVWQAFNPTDAHGPPANTVPVTLQAHSNYWGSSKGPAPDGAADAAGGACDQNNASTIANPFSATLEPFTAPVTSDP